MRTSFLATMAGLGVLGFDPLSALIALAWVLAGARLRSVWAFLATAFADTVALGAGLSLTAGRALLGVDWYAVLRTGPWPALAELVLALGCAVWALHRVRRPPTAGGRAGADRRGTRAAAGAGLLLALGWVADPGFVAAVVAGGRQPVAGTVAGWVVWVVVAQSPAVVAAVVLATPARRRLAGRLTERWQRLAPLRRRLLAGALVLAALALVLDAGWYAASGRYLSF